MVEPQAPNAIAVRAPDPVTLRALRQREIEIRPPGSKSISNRALLLAAFAHGSSQIRGLLDAEDTRLMLACLEALGVKIDDPARTPSDRTRPRGLDAPVPELLRIAGRPAGGLVAARPLHVGTAGTVARFLTAALCAEGVEAQLDGSARMRERPMGALLQALKAQGARFECLGQVDALPLRLLAHEGLTGGRIELERPRSSQFVSALMISALGAKSPTEIVLRGGTPARPYVDMTLEIMRDFGADLHWAEDGLRLLVEPGRLRACDYVVEPDASAASYWLAWAAIHDAKVCIPDLGSTSLQGDAKFHEVLARFGARSEQDASSTRILGSGPLRGCTLDLSDMPDMTLTAAIVAAHAHGPTHIDGVAILRHHESDRLAAGAVELRKLGCEVEEREGGLSIQAPEGGLPGDVAIDTYLDHRMAMAFSLAGDVTINAPQCVNKTYPGYFEQLARFGMCDPLRASEVRV